MILTLIQSEMTRRAAGDAAAIAAALADDRGRFAGDRGLVDRGDAFDHFAVAGNHVPRLDHHDVALAQRGRRDHRSRRSSRSSLAWVSVRVLRRLSACALPRPSAIASAKLANSTVNHSHSAICSSKIATDRVSRDRVANQAQRGQDAGHLDHEHDRILDHQARVELAHRIDRWRGGLYSSSRSKFRD